MPNNTLTGSSTYGTSTYGTIPNVTSPSSTAATAISGNIGNLSSLYDLAGSQNTFNTSQALSGLSSNLPGYSQMTNQSSQNILNNLQGVVSSDVQNQIANAAAERGVSGGFGVDSANSNSALLRAMGLTSMGLQQTGESQLTGAVNRTPTAQLFNMTPYLTTASDQQSAQQAANVYSSSPDPTLQATAQQNAANQGLRTGTQMGGGSQQPQNQGTSFQPTFGSGGGTGQGSMVGYSSGNTAALANPQTSASAISDWWNTYGGAGSSAGDQVDATGFSPNDYALVYGDQGSSSGGGSTYMGSQGGYDEQQWADLFGDGG